MEAHEMLMACSTPAERAERRQDPRAHREKWILRAPHLHAGAPEHFEVLLQGTMEPDELRTETEAMLNELGLPEWQAKATTGYRDLYTHFATRYSRLRLVYPKLFRSIVSHPDRLEETRACLDRLQGIWTRMLSQELSEDAAMAQAGQIHRENDPGEAIPKKSSS